MNVFLEYRVDRYMDDKDTFEKNPWNQRSITFLTKDAHDHSKPPTTMSEFYLCHNTRW